MGAPPRAVNSLGQGSPSKIGVMKDPPARARKSRSGQWSVGPIQKVDLVQIRLA